MKKGIALVTMVTVIVIISILATTLTISAVTSINNTKLYNFAKEIKMVEDFVNAYQLDNNGNVPFSGEYEVVLNNFTDDQISEIFEEEYIIDNKFTAYELDLYELGLTSLSRGLNSGIAMDMYIYSTYTQRVYYLRGETIGGKKYYRLTDDLLKVLDRDNTGITNGEVKDGILIYKTPSYPTNAGVTSKVKIPKLDISNVSVTTNVPSMTVTTATEGEFTVYTINNAANKYKDRYIINIKYKKNNIDNEVNHVVSNADIVKPIIEHGKVYFKYDSFSKKYKVQIANLKAIDKESGIKEIKYYSGEVKDDEVQSTLRQYGNKIDEKEPVIQVGSKTFILYAEDNAGNYTFKRILKEEIEESVEPKIEFGLTPIKWIGDKEYNTTEFDPDWYDYEASAKKWANAKGVDGSYFVWIPRYAYRIIYYGSELDRKNATKMPVGSAEREVRATGYSDIRGFVDKNGSPNPSISRKFGLIELEFLGKGKNKYSYKENEIYKYDVTSTDLTKNPKRLVVHPAFSAYRRPSYTKKADGNFGWDSEVTGFWVSKFEMSANGSTSKSVPGVTAERNINIDTIYKKGRNISTSILGSSNESNYTSMNLTNTQWGAIAYLTNAMGVPPTLTNDLGRITGGGIGNSYKLKLNQSTTGNITGIYDLNGGPGTYSENGGSWEYVSAYVANGNSTLTTYAKSLLDNKNTKFVDVYKKAATDNELENFKENADKYGDAMFEVSLDGRLENGSWSGNYSYYMSTTAATLRRGSTYSTRIESGIYSYGRADGNSGIRYGWRASLTSPSANAN